MSKYDEYMENICVTEEMRARILDNIGKSGLTPHKRSFISRYGAYLAVAAACVALTIVGTTAIPRIIGSQPPVVQTEATIPNDVQAVWDVTECGSAEEVSAILGFTVKEPSVVPFEYDSVSYAAKFGEIAEIQWIRGEVEAASLREANTDDDISGDYNSYAVTNEIQIENITVTAKGNNGYCLAVWTADGISYAFSTDEEISEQHLKAIVMDIIE